MWRSFPSSPSTTGPVASANPSAETSVQSIDESISTFSKYGIELPKLEGESKCSAESDKKCVALTSLLGFHVYGDEPKDVTDFCVFHNNDDVTSLCSFYFGALGAAAHHMAYLTDERYENRSNYQYDMILLHDESVPAGAIAQFQQIGLRTQQIPDSLKRLACNGFVAKNPTTNITKEMCDTLAFNRMNFPKKALGMMLTQMKPLVASFVQYEGIVFTDIDSIMVGRPGMERTLDYALPREDVGILINMDAFAPLNAGYFVIKPKLADVELWLNDLKTGFNSVEGWGEHGEIAHIWNKDFRASDGQRYLFRNGTDGNVDPVFEDRAGSWTFLGANTDQGLLFHIYVLENKNMHFLNTFPFSIPETEGMTNVTELISNGFSHCAGSPKPWDKDVCIRPHNKWTPATYTRVLKPISNKTAIIALQPETTPVMSTCARYFLALAHRCEKLIPDNKAATPSLF